MGIRHIVVVIAAVISANAYAKDASQYVLAIDRAETQTSGSIEITSPAFGEGDVIPDRYSSWREGISPQLDWAGLPDGTASLVLFMEDPDARSVRPYLHWVAWNIDASLNGLPENLAATEREGSLASLVEGTNSRKKTGYFGPHPSGSKPHHYHFQLFALDRTIELDPSAKRSDVLAAMAGHVLAKGQLMGLFTKPGR